MDDTIKTVIKWAAIALAGYFVYRWAESQGYLAMLGIGAPLSDSTTTTPATTQTTTTTTPAGKPTTMTAAELQSTAGKSATDKMGFHQWAYYYNASSARQNISPARMGALVQAGGGDDQKPITAAEFSALLSSTPETDTTFVPGVSGLAAFQSTFAMPQSASPYGWSGKVN